jgi:pectinesterase
MSIGTRTVPLDDSCVSPAENWALVRLGTEFLRRTAHIPAAGFVAMSGNQPENARFHEYQSTGSGVNTSSRSSYQLAASQAANYSVANILAPWTPSYSQ